MRKGNRAMFGTQVFLFNPFGFFLEIIHLEFYCYIWNHHDILVKFQCSYQENCGHSKNPAHEEGRKLTT
jgi:hypothetical protein